MCVGNSERKTYTLVLKNDIPDDEQDQTPTDDRPKETSTVSFEYSFSLSGNNGEEETVIVPFDKFVAYYRGKKVEKPPALDLGDVKRMSFMVRSFFGEEKQEGPFSLEVFSVVAVNEENKGRGAWCCLM
jgi:hypothetical protein